MSRNSFYIQLNPYLLAEYIYGDSSTTYSANEVKFLRISNDYADGQVQLLNSSSSQNITQNVLDTSAASLGGYKWVFLDKDVPVPYISTDSKLTLTDLGSTLAALSVVYDTVRIHIVSGYRLEDIQGLIIQVYGREAMSGMTSILANNVFLNSDDRDILNPRPIMLADRMYDRYVEVLVPSLRYINQQFFSDPTSIYSLGYQYTSDNKGFFINSSIYLKVFEIYTVERRNGILFLNTNNFYEVNVNQEDLYASLSANIQEAVDGDYFQYYPTYGGNFVEDFMSSLNASGGDYVLINDIDLYEQVGTENVLTFSFTQLQTGGFDAPLEFRPIVKYADSAVTFSIDYSVRIYNKSNGFQIIRRASTTSFNPRKYGKQLDKIMLAQQSYPFKVYNKVYGNSQVSFVNNDYSNSFSTIYVPVFYETRRIVIQHKTLLANGANPLSPDFYESIYFGQGDARIYISDFESYIKFIVSQVDPKTGAITPIDLTAGSIAIAFKDSVGNIIRYASESSNSQNSLAKGEVVFKLPDFLRTKIISSSNIQSFFLVTEAVGTSETLLYSGTVDVIENVSTENDRVMKLAITSTSVSSITGASSSVSNSTNILTTDNRSLLQSLVSSSSASLNLSNLTEVLPPSIPNFNFGTDGSVSMRNSISPVNNSNSQLDTILSQSNGSTTKLNN